MRNETFIKGRFEETPRVGDRVISKNTQYVYRVIKVNKKSVRLQREADIFMKVELSEFAAQTVFKKESNEKEKTQKEA